MQLSSLRWSKSLTVAFAFLSLLFARSVPADVAALGRLEPKDGARVITAPSTPETGLSAVLKTLLVDTGDDVSQGQVLAVVESVDFLKALLDEAEAALELAERQFKAATAEADAACVLAEVARREAKRRSDLVEQSMSSVEEFERADSDAQFQTASCQASRAAAEASEGNVRLAYARLERQARALSRASIQAPFDGTVLAIRTRPGERIGPEGILELGATAEMHAIAEVYETDIGLVRPGQRAEISSNALSAPLGGEVLRVRPLVRKQDVLGTDPAARKDARIVEVEILIDDSEAVASLTNLQVEIVIRTE